MQIPGTTKHFQPVILHLEIFIVVLKAFNSSVNCHSTKLDGFEIHFGVIHSDSNHYLQKHQRATAA